MDRKEFLKKGCQIGVLSTCSSVIAGSVCGEILAEEDDKKAIKGTPCEEKVAFAKTWIKRLMDQIDANVDQETREKLMFSCGQQCFRGSRSGQNNKPTEDKLDEFIVNYRKWTGSEESIRRDGNTVYYSYVGNGKGVKISDGFCLCPIIEDGPEKLSKTYCHCSVGYVTEMFSDICARPVKVELKESLRTGGKSCSFIIHV